MVGMSLDGLSRTYCAHGVDIAATCYACRRERVEFRRIVGRAGVPDSDRVVVLGTSRGGTTWWLDTRDGGGCLLAVLGTLVVLALLAGAVALWA